MQRERERENKSEGKYVCGEREREREKSEIVNCTREICVPVCEYYGIEVRNETVDVSVRRIGGKYSINCPRESITSK